MKLSFFMCIVFVTTSFADVLSQQKVTMQLGETTLKNALYEFQRQTNYFVYYGDDEIVTDIRVIANFDNVDYSEFLTFLLKETDMTFKEMGDHIVIVKRSETQQQIITRVITGTIKTENGEPLPGSTVMLKGSVIAVASDINGNFIIRVPDNQDIVLVVSFIGMITQEVTYKGEETLNIILKEDSEHLTEVIIPGVFSHLEETYTGSAVVITKKEIKNFGTRNIISTLRNIDPSFNIIESNEWGSDPNRLPELIVRGGTVIPADPNDLKSDLNRELNTPLIMLDGFEISLQQMMDMDVNEFETIILMKDADATSQFGSRGANGAILITSVVPEAGKLRFQYSGSVNLEIPDLHYYDLLNAREKLDLELESGYFNYYSAEYDLELKRYYNKLLQDVERGINTDWISQPVRVGIGHRNRISIGGGDDVFRYALGASYNANVGTMKDTDRNNFNGNIRLTYNTGQFRFSNALNYTESKANVNSPYGTFSQYAEMNPYYAIYDEFGKINKEYEHPLFYNLVSTPNPLYNTTLHVVSRVMTSTLTNNFQIEWNPIQQLRINAQLGISSIKTSSDDFKPADHTDFRLETDFTKKGSYIYGTGNTVNVNGNIQANYTHVFREHHVLTAGVSGELSDEKKENFNFTAIGFQNEKLDFLPMALKYPENSRPLGSESHVRRVSFAANANYSFMRKYTINAGISADGSSKYGTDNRWNYFYNFGIAWNMEKESFIERLDFINRLKIKASFGISGNTSGNAYESVPTYVYYMGQNYGGWMGSRQITLDNPNLGWAEVHKYNIGIDYAMCRNRIQLQVDLYLQESRDQLTSMLLPSSNGYSSYSINGMTTENRGIESRLTVQAIRDTERDFVLSVTGALTYEKDKVTKLSDIYKAQMRSAALTNSTSPNNIIEEGQSRHTIYTVPSLGIDPSTGKELYLKKNGEVSYTWSANDRIASGVERSPFRGNFRITAEYKDLSVAIGSIFEWGGEHYNNTLINRVENANKKKNVDRRVYEDRWIKPGDRTFFKGINETGTTYHSSRFVQKKAELQLTVLDIKYDFRKVKFIERIGLSSLALTYTFNDLLRLSTIREEKGTSYPFARNMSFGIQATF